VLAVHQIVELGLFSIKRIRLAALAAKRVACARAEATKARARKPLVLNRRFEQRLPFQALRTQAIELRLDSSDRATDQAASPLLAKGAGGPFVRRYRAAPRGHTVEALVVAADSARVRRANALQIADIADRAWLWRAGAQPELVRVRGRRQHCQRAAFDRGPDGHSAVSFARARKRVDVARVERNASPNESGRPGRKF
jgi:hypothetical protein